MEHGLMLHDGHQDEVARVPLLFVLPESSGVEPRRFEALTQSTDLAPTILDLCGLDPIGQTPSLAPAIMLGEEPEDGLVLFQTNFLIGSDEEGEYKFIKTGRTPRFYDRDTDSTESVDLLAQEGFAEENQLRLRAIFARMEELTQECVSLNQTLRSLETGSAAQLSPERIAELKALGYLGGEDDSPAPSGEAP